MAQATLQEMAGEVRLYSGDVCPTLLCERFIRDRYRSVCERNIWSFKIGRGSFGTSAVYDDGTITLSNGSATVTGSGTTFTSAMVGLQLRVSGFVFTIATYVGATEITIDQTWKGATTSDLTFDIVTAYITPADINSDFHAFYTVLDPTNSWKLRLGVNSKELDRMDARRSASGDPRIVANGVYNSSNEQMFELWPAPTAQRMYTYVYEKRVTDLSASSDTPPPIIRSDVLVKGALSDLSRWPGTATVRNPFYDPYFNQWKNREAEFDMEVNKLILEDQSIFHTALSYDHGYSWAPLDAKFMQNHAF